MKTHCLFEKHCLITGATGGIGLAIAECLWELGGTIHLTGRNVERLKYLESLWNERVHVYCHDLSVKESAQLLLKEVFSKTSSIDVLVNNSGVTKDNLALRMTDHDWDSVVYLNLSVPFFLSQGVLSGMLKKKWGRIINITSVIGHKGNAGQCNYSATKAGLCAMTKSLALEVASRGITVNSVAPGFIETAMTHSLSQDAKSKILEHTPCKLMGSPEDVAYAVEFLVTPKARFITGQTIHVNGGIYMGG
ncbi:3-oxoacyl-[acyl-carrier-protein] reductase FabG [Holospora obtusa F1]|uniref:3-oxoacyl-[acyl-carrier-protein] reductase FabG n=1 Tax=Holospora obtusa F1 TaxID=1399147 RepID=W6TFF3_HOLOB|nr:3-oxoacyl-ACP reductase FabG [Holospora obtusa]ETZ07724.1 3-oxoacyl-[acyl-carrier-protein] reductase FabG [Holospora obtusa F1]